MNSKKAFKSVDILVVSSRKSTLKLAEGSTVGHVPTELFPSCNRPMTSMVERCTSAARARSSASAAAVSTWAGCDSAFLSMRICSVWQVSLRNFNNFNMKTEDGWSKRTWKILKAFKESRNSWDGQLTLWTGQEQIMVSRVPSRAEGICRSHWPLFTSYYPSHKADFSVHIRTVTTKV